MYYIIRRDDAAGLYRTYAIGPFANREAAYKYGADREWMMDHYSVKTDTAMQRHYLHLPIHKPE